ncbi:MAG: thioredoxin [Desulfatibacillaceae bacterium]
MSESNVIVRCPSCGAKNRIPAARAGERPVCGKCGASLAKAPGLGKPVDVTDATFASEVLNNPGPVLVDCWAAWCGPCRMVGPVMDQMAADHAGRLKVAKLNVDENQGTAGRYSIQSIPTMLVFHHGREVDRLVGAVPRQEIESRLRPYL